MLDEVLGKEPDHEAARKLRDRLERERAGARPATTAVAPAVVPEEPDPPTPRQPLAALPPFATAHVPMADDEPLTPRRLSKQPPPDAPTIADYDAEPLTPRRLSKPPVDEAKPAEVEATAYEALLFRTTPTRAVVYFELPDDHVNGDAPVVHVVEWRSGAAGVESVTHEFVAGGLRGTVIVDGLLPNAVVRGALGQKRHGRFKPITVCAEATIGGGVATVVWSPRARKDYGPVAERAASHVSA
jgi:hypothetical protein